MEQAGIDEAEAVAALLERLDVVRSMFHGFDYSAGLTGTPHQRLVALAEALNWILAKQDEAAQRETDKEAKEGGAPPIPGRSAGALQSTSPFAPQAMRPAMSATRWASSRPCEPR